jgi:nitroimidazol reductase NimA-like FMN-containing flavoprotein (pyridoxamine 5'-phosphate oxidase superfamily)
MKTITITDTAGMEQIISECRICFVGFAGPDGEPYVLPMNFAYHEGLIILHSAPFGTHLQILETNNRVCITFCTDGKLVYQHPDVACSYRMDSKSVVCKSTIRFEEELDKKEELLNIFMKKYSDKSFKYSLPALKNVKIWVAEVHEMTAKAFGQPHFRQ